MTILKITENNFNTEILQATVPALVLFTAEWSAPTKLFRPSLAEIAEAYLGRVVIGEIDTDRDAEIAAQYGVRNVPTLISYKNGEKVAIHVGAAPKTAIVSIVENLL